MHVFSSEVGRSSLRLAKIESTVRYLGIEVDHAISIVEKMEA